MKIENQDPEAYRQPLEAKLRPERMRATLSFAGGLLHDSVTTDHCFQQSGSLDPASRTATRLSELDRHSLVVMDPDDDEAAMALWTGRRLFPATHTLTGCEAARTGKTLLVRPTAAALRTQTYVSLDPVTTEQDWHDYTHERVRVEAEFGADRTQTQVVVSDLRARTEALDLCLYLARDGGRLVGAIARFRLPVPHQSWARLQEVDVFPPWRGRSYGDAVLAATFALLHAEDTAMVVVGADEDDWPLNWYRKRGFHDVARVPLTR